MDDLKMIPIKMIYVKMATVQIADHGAARQLSVRAKHDGGLQGTEDLKEAMDAFIQKRKSVFNGR